MPAPGTVLGGLRVDFGSVQLGLVDSAGVSWQIATLDGWDSPEVRTQITQREFDHGAWMGPVYLGERPLTLTGSIAAPSTAALDAAIEQLLQVDALTDTTVTVWETIPKQVTVRRAGKPIIKRETDVLATFSLLVTAPDPRRYETTQQSQTTALPSLTGGLVLPAATPWSLSASSITGTITAANTGTFESRPVLSIAGPVNQPVIGALYPDGSVRQLAYSLNLNSGEVLTIDTDAHTVMLGGASRRRYISGDWPTIPAGQQVRFQFTAAAYNATASLTATWRSAWT